jgi:hypothetical protein
VIALAAVVVYGIFGLDIAAIFDLVRLVVTLLIIVLTLRIPFKRKYHWMFLILSLAILYYSSIEFYAATATDAATYVEC